MSIKGYISHDDNITWGHLAGTDTKIHDYDLVRIKYTNRHLIQNNNCDKDVENCTLLEKFLPVKVSNVTWQVDYTIDSKGFSTDSIVIDFIFPLNSRGAHLNGPCLLECILAPWTDYLTIHKSMSSLGVGLMFTY